MQLRSLRTNQSFTLNYETGEFSPQTEVVFLIEKPKYSNKDSNIIKGSELEELRFSTSTDGIRQLIGMLEDALKASEMYEKLSGPINNVIVNKAKPML